MLTEFDGINGISNKAQELQKIKNSFKGLITSKNEIIWVNAVYHQYGFKHNSDASEVFCSEYEEHDGAHWHKLSPGDWHVLLVSSSLMACETAFAKELLSSIAQMRYHELQFSNMSKGHFHAVEVENFKSINIEYEEIKVCMYCCRRHITKSSCCGYSVGGSISIPKAIPNNYVLSSCNRCNQNKKLNDHGFCSYCKRCSNCGALCSSKQCQNFSCGVITSYCSLCELCNKCGYMTKNGYILRKLTPGSLNDRCAKLGRSINLENLKQTSWFKLLPVREPRNKVLKNTYPTSKMLIPLEDAKHWSRLEYTFTNFLNRKVYLAA